MAKNHVTRTQKCPWKFCSTTHLPLLSSNLRGMCFHFWQEKLKYNLCDIAACTSEKVCTCLLKNISNRAVFTWLSKGNWFWFWFWFYYALWLASVFTLVLVLRQSSENCSIRMYISFSNSRCFNLTDGWPQTSHDRNKQDSRHFIPSSYTKPQRFWSSSMLHFIFILKPSTLLYHLMLLFNYYYFTI